MFCKLFIFLGSLCAGLGTLGVFLPLLPTTPFLLAALFFFYRSSPELARKLLDNKILGPYVASYASGAGMPLKVKVRTLILMWSVMLLSIFCFTDNLWVRLFLTLTAVAVTVHIVTFRSAKSD
ncbi:MAG: YbaN family protein [Mucinivorans sp.]